MLKIILMRCSECLTTVGTFQYRGALLDTKRERKIEEDALSKALKLLDPEGTLVPGTQEYEDTAVMVTKWFDTYGTAETLEMVRDCMQHMEGSKKAGQAC